MDLTKVLPLTVAPDEWKPPTAWYEIVVTGSSKTYSVYSCPLTPGLTVRAAIAHLPDVSRAAANGQVVLVRKPTGGQPAKEIEIDWPGSDRPETTDRDLLLESGDKLRIATRIPWPPKW